MSKRPEFAKSFFLCSFVRGSGRRAARSDLCYFIRTPIAIGRDFFPISFTRRLVKQSLEVARGIESFGRIFQRLFYFKGRWNTLLSRSTVT